MSTKPPTLFARITAFLAAGMVLAALLWLALALDAFVLEHVRYDNPLKRDWARMFRVTGYLPTWLLAAAALWMIDARPKAWLAWPSIRRAVWLAANAAASGALCEIVKVCVRRERPESAVEAGVAYVFRAWDGHWWSTSGLGFPSSHVGVSAGAACALVCLFPRAWPVWVALPIGCALTRLFEADHYFSDTVGAAIVAVVTATLLMPVFRRANKRHAPPSVS